MISEEETTVIKCSAKATLFCSINFTVLTLPILISKIAYCLLTMICSFSHTCYHFVQVVTRF